MGDDWGSFQSFKILSQAIVFTFFYFLPASTLQARVFQIPPCFSCLLIFSRAILSAWNDPFHLGSSNPLSSFPGSSAGKESACNAGDPSLISGSGRSPGEETGYPLQCSWTSLVAQMVKNLPAMWETWFDPWFGKTPEGDMATHSNVLAWRITMDRGASWATVHGATVSRNDWVTKHNPLSKFPS